MQAAWEGVHACFKRLKLPWSWYAPRDKGEALQCSRPGCLAPALGSDLLLLGGSHAVGLAQYLTMHPGMLSQQSSVMLQ